MDKRRKHISLKAQLHAALFQLGLVPGDAQLDHEPALVLRAWDEDAQDTIPPASDPRFLIWRSKGEHKIKTIGAGATTAGSDIGKAAKIRRIEKDPSGGAEFRRKLLSAKAGGEEPARPGKRKTKWPSRPFQTKRKKS